MRVLLVSGVACATWAVWLVATGDPWFWLAPWLAGVVLLGFAAGRAGNREGR